MLRSVLLSLHQEKSGSKTQWGLQVALIVGHVLRFLWPWEQWRGAAWFLPFLSVSGTCPVSFLLHCSFWHPCDYTDFRVVADSLSNCSLSIWMGSPRRLRAVTVVQLWFFSHSGGMTRFWEVMTSEENSQALECTMRRMAHSSMGDICPICRSSPPVQSLTHTAASRSGFERKKVQFHFLPACWIQIYVYMSALSTGKKEDLSVKTQYW